MSFKEAINLLEIPEKEVKEIEKCFQSQKESKISFFILKKYQLFLYFLISP